MKIKLYGLSDEAFKRIGSQLSETKLHWIKTHYTDSGSKLHYITLQDDITLCVIPNTQEILIGQLHPEKWNAAAFSIDEVVEVKII